MAGPLRGDTSEGSILTGANDESQATQHVWRQVDARANYSLTITAGSRLAGPAGIIVVLCQVMHCHDCVAVFRAEEIMPPVGVKSHDWIGKLTK